MSESMLFYDDKHLEPTFIRKCIYLTRWAATLPYYTRKHLLDNIVRFNTIPYVIIEKRKCMIILEWLSKLKYAKTADSLISKIWMLCQENFRRINIYARSWNIIRNLGGGGNIMQYRI